MFAASARLSLCALPSPVELSLLPESGLPRPYQHSNYCNCMRFSSGRNVLVLLSANPHETLAWPTLSAASAVITWRPRTRCQSSPYTQQDRTGAQRLVHSDWMDIQIPAWKPKATGLTPTAAGVRVWIWDVVSSRADLVTQPLLMLSYD